MAAARDVQGTVRYRLRLSAGGKQMALRFSNEASADRALNVGSVTVALVSAPADVKRVTFGGKRSFSAPAGAPIVSDPVALLAPAGAEVYVSVYLTTPHPTSPVGVSAELAAGQDVTEAASPSFRERLSSRPLVSAIYVSAARGTHAVVAFGDSITDGAGGQTPKGWPGYLSRRTAEAGQRLSVVNAGISGNRLLSPGMGQAGLARFDRDVLATPGMTHVILLLGINDIQFSGPPAPPIGSFTKVTAEEIIAGYEQIASRVHARGGKLIIGTLTPFKGAMSFSEEKEVIRQRVNEWIRSNRVADGVVDFDAAVRNPADPRAFKPEFDSGDHLHPSARGSEAMANAVNLALVR